MALGVIDKPRDGFMEISVTGKTFTFPKRHNGNEGFIMIGESGVIAPFIYMIGVGGANDISVNRIIDTYGLTVTATLSGDTITVTFNVAVNTWIKIIG